MSNKCCNLLLKVWFMTSILLKNREKAYLTAN